VRKFLTASLAVLALSACQGDESRDAVDDASQDAVAVRIRQIYDVSEGMYVEGSYSYVRVENLDGDKLIEKRLPLDGENRTAI
jgi:hypothetical protein